MLTWGLGAVAAALLSVGCGSIFVAKHKVLVDAIAAPGLTPATSGVSYLSLIHI